MTVEKLSEEEISQIQILKSTGRTVIEEVINRVEESEKEEIWEKLIGQSWLSPGSQTAFMFTKIVT